MWRKEHLPGDVWSLDPPCIQILCMKLGPSSDELETTIHGEAEGSWWAEVVNIMLMLGLISSIAFAIYTAPWWMGRWSKGKILNGNGSGPWRFFDIVTSKNPWASSSRPVIFFQRQVHVSLFWERAEAVLQWIPLGAVLNPQWVGEWFAGLLRDLPSDCHLQDVSASQVAQSGLFNQVTWQPIPDVCMERSGAEEHTTFSRGTVYTYIIY